MTTRKDFLAAGTALGAFTPQIALAGASPSPSPAPTEAPLPALNFDLTAFDKSLAKPAKHRHMFGSKKLSNGDVFSNMQGTIFAYDSLGIPLSEVALAGVFYHGISVYLAYDDTIWKKYIIPGLPTDKTKASALESDVLSVNPKGGNPCLHGKGDTDDQSIETLVAQTGMRLYVCNRATSGLARGFARKYKLDPVEVYKDIAAHLVPNAMLVPAGVWAVHAVQERGYTYLAVS